jgi:hypothetical protein
MPRGDRFSSTFAVPTVGPGISFLGRSKQADPGLGADAAGGLVKSHEHAGLHDPTRQVATRGEGGVG